MQCKPKDLRDGERSIPRSDPKDLIRAKLRGAVRYRRLAKPNQCEVCGNPTEARFLHGHHHNGYDHPLDVIWTCIVCHNKHHALELVSNGEENPQSKLTEQDVIQIRLLGSQGMRPARIAELFSAVCYATIWQILRRDIWKHI